MSTNQATPARMTGGGDLLLLSFGIPVVMWAVGYFCKIPPAVVPAWLLLGLLVTIQAGAGFLAGRLTDRGARAAVGVGGHGFGHCGRRDPGPDRCHVDCINAAA